MRIILFSFLIYAFNLGYGQRTITSKIVHNFDIAEDKITNSFDKNQTFNISFNDSLLIHNVYDEEFNSTDSQIYRIIDIKEKDGLITFTALSGISGKKYVYMLQDSDDDMTFMQYFMEDQTIYVFEGPSIPLKTFSQE